MRRFCIRALSLLSLLAFLCLPLLSCAKAKPVMRVGGYDISSEEYLYFYRNFEDQYTYESNVTEETIRADVEEALRTKYALHTLIDRYHITLDQDDIASVNAQVETYRTEFGGAESFAEELAAWSMDEQYFRHLLELDALEIKLRAYLSDPYTGDIPADDATVLADIYANFYHATQILITREAGDDLVAEYNIACEALSRARAGEDFDALIAEYGEDEYIRGNPVGYYFTEGQLLEEFENAVKSLDVGEISEVIVSDIGYHVIRRLPLREEEINARFDSLREAYLARTINTRLSEVAASLEIVYTADFVSP